jgi:hypothetical protein
MVTALSLCVEQPLVQLCLAPLSVTKAGPGISHISLAQKL